MISVKAISFLTPEPGSFYVIIKKTSGYISTYNKQINLNVNS